MLASQCLAQWSTSTYADSALYVCPGFYPGIITFDDGSSIVLGALQSYIYAQKLDPFGYKQWTQPVQVFDNDSSNITDLQAPYLTQWGGWVGDDSGGVILFWYDHRGGYQDPGSGYWYNNAIYAQRVDRNGGTKWTQGGAKIADPESGLKYAGIVSDGQGGCVIGWSESGFNYTGAPNYERIRIRRIDGQGNTLWEIITDTSSSAGALGFLSLDRFSDKIILHRNLGIKMFSVSGREILQPPFQHGVVVIDRDSIIFNLSGAGTRVDSLGQSYFQYKLKRYDSSLDSLWESSFEIKDEAGRLGYYGITNPIIPDGLGGIFFVWGADDNSDTPFVRATRIDSRGAVWNSNHIYQHNAIANATFFSRSKLGIYLDGGIAWLYDSLGNLAWPAAVKVISDPQNTYFDLVAPDFNGGAIVTFWTTLGGIYAQHTGRNGKVGIITAVASPSAIPTSFRLYQNYPNPFNPSTTVRYELSKKSFVTLRLYDLLGREVRTLVNGEQEPGNYSRTVEANDLPSGVYFYRLMAATFSDTKKLLLIK